MQLAITSFAIVSFRFQRKYPADCVTFHEEEIRVTTESVHNEL